MPAADLPEADPDHPSGFPEPPDAPTPVEPAEFIASADPVHPVPPTEPTGPAAPANPTDLADTPDEPEAAEPTEAPEAADSADTTELPETPDATESTGPRDPTDLADTPDEPEAAEPTEAPEAADSADTTELPETPDAIGPAAPAEPPASAEPSALLSSIGVRPSRRQLLAAGIPVGVGLLLLVGRGCGLRFGQPTTQTSLPQPTPDELARERTARTADQLALSAMAAAVARPEAASTLIAIATAHRVQARALRPAQPTATNLRAAPATTPGADDAARALRQHADRERVAAAEASAELASVSPSVARLLASVSASRTLNAVRLERRPSARGTS